MSPVWPELSDMTDLSDLQVSRITPALQSRCSFPYLALYPADMTTVGPNDSHKNSSFTVALS